MRWMEGKLEWPAGKPVLVVGYEYAISTNEYKYWYRVVYAGRLSEPFRPGRAIFLETGPMSGCVGCAAARTNLVTGRIFTPNMSLERLAAEAEREWRGGFQFRLPSKDHFGCQEYLLFPDPDNLVPRAELVGWPGQLLMARQVVESVCRRQGETGTFCHVQVDPKTLLPVP